MPMTFTQAELHTIVCALEIARERYQEHADGVVNERIAAQFDLQARRCRDLIAAIEAAA